MKTKKTGKLFALLMAGLIGISGCGADDVPEEETEETVETMEESAETEKEDTEETGENADGENGDTSEEEENETDAAEDTSENEDPGSSSDIPAPSGSSASDRPSDTSVPATAASVRPTEEELLAGDRKSVVGIIIDATRYSVSIQTPEGDCYYLTIPDTGVSGNLDFITIGQIATLTYAGALDDTALLVGISDSSLITGIYVEEYAFAIKIINAVKSMDVDALAELTNFPVFLDTGSEHNVINTRTEFEDIPSEDIFTEALVERIINYNLFNLAYTSSGFLLGGNGTPNITFDVDDDGILGIIGINSVTPDDPDDNIK